MSAEFLTDPTIVFDAAAPQRVVSLVPSTTASLFDLGLGHALIGVSDFCNYPEEQVAGLPRLGGPKSLRVADILALQPDLILANREENDRDTLEALVSAGANVWLTFPTGVEAAIQDLWTLANLFRSDQAMRQVDFLERAVEWAEMAALANGQSALRYFCPIWEYDPAIGGPENGERWWMTFNERTYPNDVLRIMNGVNVFAGRDRRYPLAADLGQTPAEEPGERDTRYPRVSLSEITAALPEIILLPSEPYSYSEKNCAVFQELFAETPAAQSGRIYALDGTLITWHGTRLARALEELPDFFRQ